MLPCYPEAQIQPGLSFHEVRYATVLTANLVSRLPAEVLDEIFSYALAPTLARLALVCHTFQGVATRLLYRHIPSLSLSLTTRCLETLASNPYLAAHTRTCEIGDATLADASRKGLLPPSFFDQLRRALHNMHRLTELTFLLNGSTSHVLPGAPFRLTKLTASCDFDATFASWLTEQSGLHAAIFCGNFTPGVTLPADSLPLLQRVAAAPLTLACVLPGRPIREIELCLVHPWSLNRDVLQMAMRVIAYSKTPLDSLKIITHLSESPETVLSALEAIPAGLNSITKLALHAVSGSITDVRILSPIRIKVVSGMLTRDGTHSGHPFGLASHLGSILRPQVSHPLLQEQIRRDARCFRPPRASGRVAHHLRIARERDARGRHLRAQPGPWLGHAARPRGAACGARTVAATMCCGDVQAWRGARGSPTGARFSRVGAWRGAEGRCFSCCYHCLSVSAVNQQKQEASRKVASDSSQGHLLYHYLLRNLHDPDARCTKFVSMCMIDDAKK